MCFISPEPQRGCLSLSETGGCELAFLARCGLGIGCRYVHYRFGQWFPDLLNQFFEIEKKNMT